MATNARHPVLVTGASGFIGKRLVSQLVGRHERVSCLVRAESNLDGLKELDVQLLSGDVTDPKSVVRGLAESRAGTVIHLAGLVRARNRSDFTRVNVGGVDAVAAACAAQGDPPVLVIVSSLAAAGPCLADRVRVESDTPAPVSHYGRSKLAGEHVAAKYAGTVPITIVRPPIVFGPGDRAMLEVFRPIARWGVHAVPGKQGGDHRVSLVHVDDLVDGILLAAEKGERLHDRGPQGHGVYFLSAEDCPTYADLGTFIARALGLTPPTVIRVPSPVLKSLGICGDLMSHIRRRVGWINSDKMSEALAAGSWTCSSVKAREQLGWSTASPGKRDTLADRLHETAEWYRKAGWL